MFKSTDDKLFWVYTLVLACVFMWWTHVKAPWLSYALLGLVSIFIAFIVIGITMAGMELYHRERSSGKSPAVAFLPIVCILAFLVFSSLFGASQEF